MNKKEATTRMCELVRKASRKIGVDRACFCSLDMDPSAEVSEDAIRYVETAVREKIDGAKPNMATLPALVRQLQYRKLPVITSICIIKDAYNLGLKEAKDAYEAEVARIQAEKIKSQEIDRLKGEAVARVCDIGNKANVDVGDVCKAIQAL